MALKCENSVKKALKESRIKRNRELMNKSYKSDLSAGSRNSKPSSSSGFMSGKGSDTLQRLDSRRAAIFSVAKASLYGLSFVFLAPIVLGTLYEWGRAASERARYDLVDAGRGARGAGDRACSLDGNVRDCGCEYFQVDALNEEVVRPSLEAIVRQKYFSFFKVDLHCACPFWPDDSMCSMPACSVCECKDDQVRSSANPPPPLLGLTPRHFPILLLTCLTVSLILHPCLSPVASALAFTVNGHLGVQTATARGAKYGQGPG